MKGYEQANLIEKQIRKLIEKEDITKDNALEWLNFARTISTGLQIITYKANSAWKEGNS